MPAKGQIVPLPCQSDADAADPAFIDATIGLDRKDFLGGGNSSSSSEGYLHNFTLPAMTDPCTAITNVEIVITAISSTNNSTGGCPIAPYFYNIYYGCGSLLPASCDPATTLLGEPNTPTFTNQNLNYNQTPVGGDMDFGEVISVDIIPVSVPGCFAVSNNLIDLEYDICVTVTIDNLAISTPVDLGPDAVICTGTTTPIDAGSYSNYAWDPNGEMTQVINVGQGTYTVTVTDANGCTDTDEITVTEDGPTVSISATEPDLTVCPGATTDLTVTHNGSSVLWSTAQTTPTITVTPGNYTVEVTDNNGCTNTAQITINGHPTPPVDIVPNPTDVCGTNTTSIGVTQSYPQYLWSTSQTTQNITVGSGMYTVTVTDNNGCTNEASSMVNSIQPPIAGSNNTINVCNDGTPYDLFALLGAADAGGTWSDDDGSGVNVNLAPTATNFTGVPQGIYDYTYVVPGTAPCPNDQATITVTVFDQLDAGSDYNEAICFGTTSFNLEDGLGFFDLGGVWADIDNVFVDLTFPDDVDFTGVPPGIYLFTYRHTGSGACASSTANVTIEVLEEVNAGGDVSTTVCAGAEINLFTLVTPDADTNGFFDEVVVSGALNGDNFNTNAVTPGTYTVLYIVDANTLTCDGDTAIITIEVGSSVSAGMDSTYFHCDTSTLDLNTLLRNADGGGNFVATGTTTGLDADSLVTSLLGPGTYTYWYIVGDDIICPFDTSTLSITIAPVPEIVVSSTAISVCENSCTEWTINNLGDSIPTIELILLAGADSDTVRLAIADGTFNLVICGDASEPSGYITGDTILTGGTADTLLTSIGLAADNACFPQVLNDGTVITYNQAVVTSIDTLLCATDTITIGGEVFVGQNVSRSDTLAGVFCDSIVMIDIVITPADTTIIADTYCFSDTVNIGGNTYSISTPRDTIVLPTLTGCDSTVFIDLSFLPRADTVLDLSLCTGDFITVDGVRYDESNPTGIDTLLTQNTLCDSIVTINLTFGNDVQVILDDTLCAGTSITVAGTVYDASNASGVENIPGPSCDTMVVIDLTFVAEKDTLIQSTFCPDFSIVVGGTTYDQTNTTGAETLTSVTHPLCDSTVTIDLSFFQEATSVIDTNLCEGEVLVVGPDTYDESMSSGITNLPGQSLEGCDSMVSVNIVFAAPFTEDVSVTICQGDSLFLEGAWQTMAGTYTDMGIGSNGCDSTTNTTVVLEDCNVSIALNVNDVGCFGENTGSAVIEINSDVAPPFTVQVSDGAGGYDETISNTTAMGAVTFENMPAGTYSITIVDATGAEVYTSTLTIDGPAMPLSAVAQVAVALSCTIANGQLDVDVTGGTGPYTYEWDNGTNLPSNTITNGGTYSVTVTDDNTCTAISMVTVDEQSDIDFEVISLDPLCDSNPDGSITVENISGGTAPYDITFNGQTLDTTSLDQLPSGTYTVEVSDMEGCATTVQVSLIEQLPTLILGFEPTYEVTTGESVTVELDLAANVEQLIAVYNSDTLACNGCSSFTITANSSGTMLVIAVSAEGCQEEAIIQIITNAAPPPSRPNIFSPNGDGANEEFIVQPPAGTVSSILKVYDKWGNVVHSTAGTDVLTWDGRYRGRDVVSGLYIYILTSIDVNGATSEIVDELTVLR